MTKLCIALIIVHSIYCVAQWDSIPNVRVQTVSSITQSEPQTYVGTVRAYETVNITAKVAGTLWESRFKEGAVVKKGDLLFKIEDTIYKASLQIAEAQLKQIEAEWRYAQKEDERYQALYKAKTAAITTAEEIRKTLESFEAKIEEAKANVTLKRNDLDYTEIKAPLTGRIGQKIFSEGNYITPSSGYLATIVQFDPIKIRFAMSESDFFKYFKNGVMVNSALSIIRADGSKYPGKAKLDFFDNQVDSQTGTMMIQLICDNHNMELIPGGYVRIHFTEIYNQPKKAISVTAIMFNGKNHYVYVINKENKAEERIVHLGDQIRGMQVIHSGVKLGERVVITGLNKVRSGATVNPIEAKIN